MRTKFSVRSAPTATGEDVLATVSSRELLVEVSETILSISRQPCALFRGHETERISQLLGSSDRCFPVLGDSLK